jgi:protein-S-isoprenylcysteine O-methyltransferase Ste14
VLFTNVRPLPFVWPYWLVFWAVYAWAFMPEWKVVRGGMEGVKASDSKDSGSLGIMLGAMWIALMLAFPLAFVGAWMFPQRALVPLFAAGLTLILLGSLLRRYCFRSLGKYFTGDVRARADQPVISTGPYRLIRHPSYTAGMMMFIGIGLALGNVVSLALVAVTAIVTYSYRVAIEERALVQTIGEPYRNFMKDRKRFIPYIV